MQVPASQQTESQNQPAATQTADGTPVQPKEPERLNMSVESEQETDACLPHLVDLMMIHGKIEEDNAKLEADNAKLEKLLAANSKLEADTAELQAKLEESDANVERLEHELRNDRLRHQLGADTAQTHMADNADLIQLLSQKEIKLLELVSRSKQLETELRHLGEVNAKSEADSKEVDINMQRLKQEIILLLLEKKQLQTDLAECKGFAATRGEKQLAICTPPAECSKPGSSNYLVRELVDLKAELLEQKMKFDELQQQKHVEALIAMKEKQRSLEELRLTKERLQFASNCFQ